jgi:hypothetical protein
MDHLSKELKALRIDDAASKSNGKFDILEFLKKGGAGRAIFREHILPFLSLDDIVSSARCCRHMNALPCMYTVGKVLAIHSMDHVSRDHKTELRKFVMAFVNPKYIRKTVYYRRVRTETETFRERVYHPSVLPDILLAMTAYFTQHGMEFDAGMEEYDWDANNDPKTPILVKATYGCGLQTTDVTTILRFLLMRQGNKRLIMRPPPKGPRYWYNYLFGDPVYRKTKLLHIWVQFEGEEESITHTFSEDKCFKMCLRASSAEATKNRADLLLHGGN